MSKSVSLSLPLDPYALQKGAELLADLADHFATAGEPFCKHCGAYEFPEPAEVTVESESDVADRSDIEATIPSGEGGTLETEQPSEAAVVFGNTAEVLEAAAGVFGTVAPSPEAGTTVTSPESLGTPIDPAPGVELDGVGLPWDGRIHGSGKTKYAKAPHGWKMKRGVSAELVAEVEAELRGALAASPANPVVPETVAPATNVAPPPPAAVTVANPGGVRMVTVIQCGQPVEVPIEAVIFPEFMAWATAGGFTPDAVLAAVNKAGVASVVLLATRPDLIPVVMGNLSPVGA